MKTFKIFVEEMGTNGVAVNNIAHSGKTQIAKYDPLLKMKMFRRKPKPKKGANS
jgi:hypothetical protein